MNTDQERAVFAVAEAQDRVAGDVEEFALFGVAHVREEDEAWLAELDLDLPPVGWYMVTKSDSEMIHTFPAVESVCLNWYQEMKRLHEAQEGRT